MPIYDEEELELYSNPNYVLSLLEEDKTKKQDEEKKEEIYPDYSEINKGSYPDFAEITGEAKPSFKSPRRETVSDLRNDEQFQQWSSFLVEASEAYHADKHNGVPSYVNAFPNGYTDINQHVGSSGATIEGDYGVMYNYNKDLMFTAHRVEDDDLGFTYN